MDEDKQIEERFPGVDRRQSGNGIVDGGRRASDKLGGLDRRWFLVSMAVSLGIMVYAFTIPLRSDTLVVEPEAVVTVSNPDSGATEFGGKTAEEFREDLLWDEQQLQRKIRESKREPTPAPSKTQLRARWEKTAAKLKEEADEIKRISGENIEKGSIQWQKLESLKDIYEDGPEWAGE